MAEERRRDKRIRMSTRLVIKKPGANGNGGEISTETSDVSRSGVGFISPETLRIGEVYEFFLTIRAEEIIQAFLQIVRIEVIEDDYFYGAMFIGLPEAEFARIEECQTISENV